MTKKVTISVPDELHEKMERWRNEFNFSRIFQDAVGEAIGDKDSIRKKVREDTSMQEIIERLRREKAESEAKATRLEQDDSDRKQAEREAARVAGLEWAKTAHYDQLKKVGQLIEEAREAHIGAERTAYITQLHNLMEQLRMSRVDTGTVQTKDRMAKYDSEWQDGVLEFWKEVRDKL